MTNTIDFGFASEEFLGNLTTVPYCQFLNASATKFGLGITVANAELAGFEMTKDWEIMQHEFEDGTQETMLVTKSPSLVILNRSKPLMSDGSAVLPYDKAKFSCGEFQAFSYAVCWFLDEDNQAISTLPFRLKCSGYAGMTFLKNYSYYSNPNSFSKKFLATYKKLTGDPAAEKNNVFYAHGVYQPKLIRDKVTSRENGKSSFATITSSFTEPEEQNFAQLIIKNGSEVSNKIKEFIETTKLWLNSLTLAKAEESIQSQPDNEPIPRGWKAEADAIEWACSNSDLDRESILTLFQNVRPDDKGRKKYNFYRKVLEMQYDGVAEEESALYF